MDRLLRTLSMVNSRDASEGTFFYKEISKRRKKGEAQIGRDADTPPKREIKAGTWFSSRRVHAV